MITAHALRWPPAHARNAATQGIDIEVDLDAEPTASEFDVTLLEAHGPYSKEAALANLKIWAKPREHYSVGGLNDVLQEECLRLEPAAAFHELDALRSDDSFARRAIRLLAKTQIPYRETLSERLEALLRDYQEDYEDRSLSPTAIAAFVSFLDQYPSVKKPSVTATPAGDLYVEWSSRPDRLFGARFMPSGEVQYVVFMPNPLHTGRTDRSSGSTTADVLMEWIRQMGVLDWLTK